MSLHSVISIVAKNYIEPHHSPLFDTARQLATINVAFGFSGSAQIKNIHPPCGEKLWANGYKEALKGLQCRHVDEDVLKKANVRTRRGKRKVLVNMEDVRRVILMRHANKIEKWIACKCGIDVPASHTILSMMLPFTGEIDTNHINNVYNTCIEFERLMPSFLELDGAVEYIKDVFTKKTYITLADIADALTPLEHCQRVAAHIATRMAIASIHTQIALKNVVLLQDLILSSVVAPGPHAIVRAHQVRNAYYNMPAQELVQDCVKFIMTGEPREVISKLESEEYAKLAVIEEATQYGVQDHEAFLHALVNYDLSTCADLVWVLRIDKELKERAALYDLFVEVDLNTFTYVVMDVLDVDGFSASQVIDMFAPNSFVSHEELERKLCDFPSIRAMFDRYHVVKNATEVDDVLGKFVMHGLYIGPEMPSSDIVECVTMYMEEVDFLMKKTDFDEIASATDNDTARMAIVYNAVQRDTIETLPRSLRWLGSQIAMDTLKNAWAKAYE